MKILSSIPPTRKFQARQDVFNVLSAQHSFLLIEAFLVLKYHSEGGGLLGSVDA